MRGVSASSTRDAPPPFRIWPVWILLLSELFWLLYWIGGLTHGQYDVRAPLARIVLDLVAIVAGSRRAKRARVVAVIALGTGSVGGLMESFGDLPVDPDDLPIILISLIKAGIAYRWGRRIFGATASSPDAPRI